MSNIMPFDKFWHALKIPWKCKLAVIRKILTVAVDRPESSDATLIPFERVVTFVSGTLYKDYKNNMKPNQWYLFGISYSRETGATVTIIIL